MKKKKRKISPKPSVESLVKAFWDAPSQAFFTQETISAITLKAIKTLECERYLGTSIPYRKVGGRVLYQKGDVLQWLENHELVTSTKEYKNNQNDD